MDIRILGPLEVVVDDEPLARRRLRRMLEGVGVEVVGEAEDGERLGWEREVLGFYLSGHPLDRYREQLERFADCLIGELHKRFADGAERLRAELERFDREDLEPGLLEPMLVTAEALARHYDVPLAAQRSKPEASGHGFCH